MYSGASWKDGLLGRNDAFLTSRYQTLETVQDLSFQPSAFKVSDHSKTSLKGSNSKRVIWAQWFSEKLEL